MYGQRLKEARKKKKLSQEKVAEILNISRSNITKYELETLEPNLQTLKELCIVYNVSADYIIGLTEINIKE
ncbi:MAG: helix-turn-helix transcriptional regulator [Ruminococcus sp.]|nr:helix-turn-helix transcriptional regulator [Ruminococcus sp.]MBR1739056.1 helix-turn-helix transcriptional regulator [Ruminococcus sp.]